jgi:hypothetical protein
LIKIALCWLLSKALSHPWDSIHWCVYTYICHIRVSSNKLKRIPLPSHILHLPHLYFVKTLGLSHRTYWSTGDAVTSIVDDTHSNPKLEYKLKDAQK